MSSMGVSFEESLTNDPISRCTIFDKMLLGMPCYTKEATGFEHIFLKIIR